VESCCIQSNKAKIQACVCRGVRRRLAMSTVYLLPLAIGVCERPSTPRFQDFSGYSVQLNRLGMQAPESGFCCSFQIRPMSLQFQLFPVSTGEERSHVALNY
jgi:hypothetical protein